MAFYKSNWFKYTKNLIIGVGASLVMLGALGKINSEPWGGTAITIGLLTEAFIFLFLGVLPPEKDYYWDKLYPGLGNYHSRIAPITAGDVGSARALDGEKVENQLGGMLSELQTMAKSLSSLKALQEVDFSRTSDQVQAMNNFYDKINQAMANISEAVEDTERYKQQVSNLNENMDSLNNNLSSFNNVYGNVVAGLADMSEAVEESKQYRAQVEALNTNMNQLNANLSTLNNVYGGVLTAFGRGGQNQG